MAKKYYAVRVGKMPGIYETWEACKAQVHGYPSAEYKSFSLLEDAKTYLIGEQGDALASGVEYKPQISNELEPDNDYAFVDGSFNIATGVYGFGGFLIHNDQRFELSGSGNDAEMASMRNVAGEILGSMAAIKKALELGLKSVSIYYDYTGIKMWANGEWKRNKKGTVAYYDYVQGIKNEIDIRFVKVKGHTGVEGNEEADRLAKKAVGII